MRKSILLVAVVASGCTTSVNGEVSVDAAPISVDADLTNPAVARGEEWVAAMVPYCQAINHAPDNDAACASTCTRPDNLAWDPYRSDCSGFVSWAWALPSTGGGRTTAGFAPFKTDITRAIAAAELLPGDAVNNSTHMMLFKGWVGAEATFMEEPGCSSKTPFAHEFTSAVTVTGTTIVVQGHGTFTAIRRD